MKRRGLVFSILVFALFVFGAFTVVENASASEGKPLYLAIIWHMHQPYYEMPNGTAILPWVRLHAAKDYFRMAWLSQLYPDVHVTIDLTGSLLLQLEDLIHGKLIDERYLISEKLANGENLTIQEKWKMLQIPGGFFDINWNHIVYQYGRYKQLLEKRNEAFKLYGSLPPKERMEKITSYFTMQDYIDLCAMFNLYWLDHTEVEKRYPNLAKIWSYGKYPKGSPNYHPFTRQDIKEILEAQLNEAKDVIPEHKKLQDEGIIEVITTPYTHPLSPLLVDMGWPQDLEIQVEKGIEIYEKLFGQKPYGFWPPEEAVNQEVLQIFANYGIHWIVTDPLVAAHADPAFKPGSPDYYKMITVPYYVQFPNGKKIYVVFRDTILSNKVSFTYSGMSAQAAVSDFINSLLKIKDEVGGGRLVVIALDGENPWENYPNDGMSFLTLLYQKLTQLDKEGIIKPVTVKEYLTKYGGASLARQFPKAKVPVLSLENVNLAKYTNYASLPRKYEVQLFPEGSWAGGELSTWIGTPQENIAWMWLKYAREILYNYVKSHGWPWLNQSEWDQKAKNSLEALLRAEGSDWFYWYGPENSGDDPAFDHLYKIYLSLIYEDLGLKPPVYLKTNYFPDGTPWGIAQPYRQQNGTISPDIFKGIVESEWKNAAIYYGNTLKGGAGTIYQTYIGCDYKNIYLGVKLQQISPTAHNYTLALYIGTRHYSPHKNYLGIFNETSVGFEPTAAVVFKNILVTSSAITLPSTPLVYLAQGGQSWKIKTGSADFLLKSEGGGNYTFTAKIPYSDLGINQTMNLYFTVVLYKGKEPVARSPPVYPGEIYVLVKTKAKAVFYWKDPEGDDHGPGTYVYPKASVFKPGVFDLLNFSVYDLGNSIEFKFVFRNLGGNPWNGPNGFCLQIIELYVDDAPGGSIYGSNGSNVLIGNPWEWMIRITGWPSQNYLKLANGKEFNGVLTVTVNKIENAVVVIVPKKIQTAGGTYVIGTPQKNWNYTVLVGSQDGYGVDDWRPVNVKASTWTIGGADPKAVATGVAPRVMDCLSPPWTTQEKMLSSYNTKTGMKAVVYGVGYYSKPTHIKITPTPTPTPTPTVKNLPPSIKIEKVEINEYNVQMTLLATDPDGNLAKVVVYWDDGSNSVVKVSGKEEVVKVSHTYKAKGNYYIFVYVYDTYNASTYQTFTAKIPEKMIYPTPTPTATPTATPTPTATATPTPTPTPTPKPSSGPALSGGAIAGIVIAICVAIGVGIWAATRRRK